MKKKHIKTLMIILFMVLVMFIILIPAIFFTDTLFLNPEFLLLIFMFFIFIGACLTPYIKIILFTQKIE